MTNPKSPKSNPKPRVAEKNVLSLDPGTLVLIISLLILLPLLATGFISQ